MALSALALALVLLGAGRSEAALVGVDLGAPGDGQLTRDTATNLDWLDVTLTAGQSYDTVAAASADTWRPASGSPRPPKW